MIYLELNVDGCYRVVIKSNRKVIGEFERGDDGFYYYWPAHDVYGSYSTELLSALANNLDTLNAPHKASLNKYFNDRQTLHPSNSTDSI